ncbi:hypothetical protein Tco_0838641 [Tanacetum coccineum]|uniref:Uncharacterized protein n=1 Tax=Tanacetum coccineum TaxID=301880 RepID=A0ABQ5ATC3_9ASTR
MSFSKRPRNDVVCYTKPLDSLKNWNDRFFWVDSFACPASFPWSTSKGVPKDPFPKSSEFNAEHYAILVAHPAPFHKYPEPFLCLVGISRYYTLDGDTYPEFLRDGDEGRVVPLLPVAPARASGELEVSVDKLFDEGGGGEQLEQGDFAGGGQGKYVRSGCTTALNVVPWETDGESVLREACLTRASFHDLLLMTNTIVTTPVNVTGAPVTNTVANHAEKPEKFNGQNFKRWQQKMFFHLGTLNLAWFLNETAPQVKPPKEDFLCHNYVLNGLVGSLYNVYCKTTTAKELWESLERKHKTEDAGTKKFYRNLVEFL